VSLRVLARSSALYTVGNLAPKVGAFVLLPIYLRFLSRSDYGIVALLTTVSGLMTLILTFGLDGALMRLHFDFQGNARIALYSTLATFTLGSSFVLVALFGAVTGPFFPDLFTGIAFLPLGLLTLAIAFASTIQYVPSVLLRATGSAGYFLLYNLGTFTASSVGSIVLLVVLRMGPAGVLLGQLIGDLVALAVAVALVFSLGRPSFSRPVLNQALRFGLPLVPHGISAWVLRLSDRWLIGLLIGLPVLGAQAAIGVYSFGYQIGAVIGLIVTSFNAAWSPYFFRIGDRPAAPILFRNITTLVMGGLLAMAVGLSALSPEIVSVVATSRYAQAVDVIPVVAFASVCQGLYMMVVTLVFFTKRTGRLALITLASAILNVAINIGLIPVLGIMGAAWSTLVAFAFFAGATWFYAQRFYPVHIDVARIGALAIAAVAAVFIARFVSVPDSLGVQALVHLLIAAAYLPIVAALVVRPLLDLRGFTNRLATPAEQP
jgi:O-antigen/teichoic acid export membrane protein